MKVLGTQENTGNKPKPWVLKENGAWVDSCNTREEIISWLYWLNAGSDSVKIKIKRDSPAFASYDITVKIKLEDGKKITHKYHMFKQF